MKSLGLHLIALNEEVNATQVIAQVCQICDEFVVVVDDRTRDDTVRVLETTALSLNRKKERLRVFVRPLNMDFSALRNFGLEQATTDWILHLDGDERLSQDLLRWIEKWLQKEDDGRVDGIAVQRENLIDGRPIGDHTYEWHIRLFRANQRFQGRIHERIDVPKDRRRATPPDCRILHHKSLARQEMRNREYMEWPEQRAIVGADR